MTDTWTTIKDWPDALRLERLSDAGVARIMLNRPEKKNSLTGEIFKAFFNSLEIIRADRELKVLITKGEGGCYSSGFYLPFLRAHSHDGLADWDKPRTMDRLAEELRFFPRVTIAQVEGYCLGGALAMMNSHDLVFAAEDAQMGMPEVMRGSFGQFATCTLFHSQIPMKKAAYIQLVGENISGAEADRVGLVSRAYPAAELEGKDQRLRARIVAAPSRGAGARQDRGADGARSVADRRDEARSSRRPTAGESGRCDGRYRHLSQIAKGRAEPRL